MPTELGRLVNDLLVPRFRRVFDVSFTSQMEEELDQIAEGKRDWQDSLAEFWDIFSELLVKAEKELPELQNHLNQETGEVCPKCGKPLIEKWGRFGKFLACSGFPDCRYTRPLGDEPEPEKIDKKCPDCGADLVIKIGRFGRFLACSRYPECKHTSPYILPQPCPLCGSEVLELRGKRGKFYRCSNEDCEFASAYPLLDEHCPDCNAHMVASPKETYCVKCHPEKLKSKKSDKNNNKKE